MREERQRAEAAIRCVRAMRLLHAIGTDDRIVEGSKGWSRIEELEMDLAMERRKVKRLCVLRQWEVSLLVLAIFFLLLMILFLVL